MGIGEILKEARVANNLTLDDIQEMTKIQKRYLVAIEQDDYHALPGRFYARAFIKEYAQAVGLDASEVLQGFDEDKIQTEEEQSVQYTRMERSRRSRPEKGGSSILSFLPTVIVIVLIIGIIFVAWTLYLKNGSKSDTRVEDHQENDEIIRNIDGDESENIVEEDNESEEENDDEQESTDEEAQEESEAGFTVIETGTGNSPLSELDFNYSGNKVEVTFDVSSTSYVQIKGENETVYLASELQPGSDESLDLSEEERIYFNIGNTSGLIVKINGEELEYPVDPNEKIHQKLWINLKQNE